MSNNIRLAQLEDVPALDILVNSAYRGESSKQGWTTEAHLLGGMRTNEKLLEKTLKSSQTTVLVYEEAGQILGTVCLELEQHYVYLGMLTVQPQKQGDGIGKKLLLAAEEFTRANNRTKIRMTVISVRHELIAYYERKGYKNTGETQDFPMNDPNFGEPKQFLEFIVMEKNI